jgi:hypothetical protein
VDFLIINALSSLNLHRATRVLRGDLGRLKEVIWTVKIGYQFKCRTNEWLYIILSSLAHILRSCTTLSILLTVARAATDEAEKRH